MHKQISKLNKHKHDSAYFKQKSGQYERHIVIDEHLKIILQALNYHIVDRLLPCLQTIEDVVC